jgi:hypothetical protein
MIAVGELTARVIPAGGEVAREVSWIRSAVSPFGHRQIVILIHGYANSQPDACASFQTCIDNLAKLPPPASTTIPAPFFKFYWPGDTNIRAFSELSYPWEITPAVDSGKRLATFLEGLSGPGGTPVELHLIAHSLGNRVTLEMMKAFSATKNPLVIFRSYTLMAAAVPVGFVSDPARLLAACSVPRRTQALCSISDQVLHLAFPLGETAAGEGFFPEAVGRFGHPDRAWGKTIPMSDYGHGDYWKMDTTSWFLANFLELPVALPPVTNGIPQNQPAPKRDTAISTIPARETLSRQI